MNVTSADKASADSTAGISLNLSALAEENMGSAIAELAAAEQTINQTSDDESSEAEEKEITLPPPSETSMRDYYQLQQNLLLLTLIFTAVIFFMVWSVYSLTVALNYVVGAVTGLVYFRMLAKSVGGIGREKPKPSSGRLAIFVGVMVVSTQWQQLSILPVFLGFLTYKAALIAFVIWTALMPQPETA